MATIAQPHVIPPSVQIANTDLGVDVRNDSLNLHTSDEDEKEGADHLEDAVPTLDELNARLGAIPRSAYATLSPLAAIRKFKHQFCMGALAAVGALYVGYCYAAVGNIVANEGFIRQFGVLTNGEYVLRAKDVSTWGAVQQCGQIFTQLISPWFIDRYGRKSVMYALSFFFGAAIVVSLVARDARVFLVAKLLAGMACGCLGTSIMTYMSEVSLPNYRGILLSLFSWMMSIGSFTNAIACQIVVKVSPLAYRHVFYSEFAILGLWVPIVVFLPESHLWYISQGKLDKAKASHRRLVGKVEGYDYDAEFEILKTEIETSEALTAAYSGDSWWALLTKRDNILRCIVASLPFAAQQFSGVPYVYNYTTYFFQLGGLADPFLGNVIIQVVSITCVVLSFFLVDKLGRRPLVVWGLGALGIFNFAIGGMGWLNRGSKASAGGLLTMCCLWVATYNLTLAPLGWVGIVEVSSSRLRAKTAAFAVLVNSLCGVVFNYTVPLLLSDQGAGWNIKIGLFFGGLSFLFLIPVFFLYPETRGRTYGEIDELFSRRIPARKFASTKTAQQEQDDLVRG